MLVLIILGLFVFGGCFTYACCIVSKEADERAEKDFKEFIK